MHRPVSTRPTRPGPLARRLVATTAAVATALTAALGMAAPSTAIVGGGSPDTAHANVGVLLPTPASPVARWCAVTPVSPSVLVLAGHCALLRAQNFGETTGEVTFDPAFGAHLGDRASGWAYTGSYPTYSGRLVAHPAYALNGWAAGYDVAVMLLDQPLSGVASSPLAAEGALDALKAAGTLRDQVLTQVGYGTTERLPGNAYVGGGYRQAADQVVQSLASTTFQHKGVDGSSGCNLDSGSPVFLGDRLVGVVSEGDAACSTRTASARLDAPDVRSWVLGQVASAG